MDKHISKEKATELILDWLGHLRDGGEQIGNLNMELVDIARNATTLPDPPTLESIFEEHLGTLPADLPDPPYPMTLEEKQLWYELQGNNIWPEPAPTIQERMEKGEPFVIAVNSIPKTLVRP